MKPLIIIPTYNERENIGELVPTILSLGIGCDILIVDDNSPDGTGKKADEFSRGSERVFVLHRDKKEGLGKAYIAGFKWALSREYDPILEMDGDLSHNPLDLPRFLQEMEKKNYDLVIGSRLYQGKFSVINWDFRRVLLSRFGTLYARIVTGVPMSDATSGFKCFRRKVLEAINFDEIISEGYSFQIEMNWRAHRAGFRVGEIPIIFYERKYGESKMSGSIVREALWVLWKMRIKQ